jgi:hypothetical protein
LRWRRFAHDPINILVLNPLKHLTHQGVDGVLVGSTPWHLMVLLSTVLFNKFEVQF